MLASVNVSLIQLAIVALGTHTTGPSFMVTMSSTLCPSLSFVLTMYSFISLTGQQHSPSAHFNVIAG